MLLTCEEAHFTYEKTDSEKLGHLPETTQLICAESAHTFPPLPFPEKLACGLVAEEAHPAPRGSGTLSLLPLSQGHRVCGRTQPRRAHPHKPVFFPGILVLLGGKILLETKSCPRSSIIKTVKGHRRQG